ncbi:MAG: alternate F1F0 ATPase, F1 subunit alpha [Planctomycetes bacterium]|nr:alternate F1F0 ATPase, F1 subunit alpha [Planctomycetota bacterium]
MSDRPDSLGPVADAATSAFDAVLAAYRPRPAVREVGIVVSVGSGVARVKGLPNAQSEELLRFDSGRLGMVFNLDRDEIGVVLLDEGGGIEAGDEVLRTGRVMDAPVGEALLGRVIDPTGRPLDESGPPAVAERRPAERPAPPIIDRAPVATPLETGIKVVDALIPIGRGQRELIVGDRQTGKTAIAVDTIINQRGKGVLCIYCAVGQRASAVARVVADLREHGALEHTIVVVTTGDDAAGLQFIAPYAAATMGEYFMEKGRDVLVVFDDLEHHARAYREVSLLLRRPPGREAYPGDIFYIHSRLLERATRLRKEKGGGSMTAMPIVETQAQNMSAFIPTNLISITDGQIALSPDLFQKGVLPAVDVGRSVSRVGGKAQLPAYRAVAGDLKLAYAQFEELERFSRYGTRLDEDVRHRLERGRRVREILKQPQFGPMPVARQIAVLFAVAEGLFDHLPMAEIAAAEAAVAERVAADLPDLCTRIAAGEKITDADREALRSLVAGAVPKKVPAEVAESAGGEAEDAAKGEGA